MAVEASMTAEYYDNTRTVILYQAGVEVGQRPYTVEENAEADLRDARITNEASLRVDAVGQLDILLVSIATLQTVIDKPNASITGADTKTVARECKRVERQVLRLSRILLGSVDSIDTGIE